ncbi:hypothetical protein EMPS_09169 [Entomortierella parvispora]|uniref:F-box domain-containing protein n=1 Tax=Entomortierella parvispora TaxID=205924 RepID=A0A9P3M0C0_9FUNG|nr:hypothetical protein EMPS_09169 [Entomortierella parvispora]
MNIPTALPTLVTIPTETLETILPYLNQGDLYHCVLTCREWNRTLIPYLWRTLSVCSSARASRFGEDALRALKMNGSLIRELHLGHRLLYERCLPWEPVDSNLWVGEALINKRGSLVNLTRLHTLELKSFHHFVYGFFHARVTALVRQNPSIQCFKISRKMDASALMQLVIQYMPNLEDLEIDTVFRGDVKELLENLPEKVRTVKLRTVEHLTSPATSGPDDTKAMARKVRSHHALESLTLSGLLSGREEDVLVKFLESCSPKLKIFDGMGCFWCTGNKAVAKALSSIGFVWTVLRWNEHPYNIADEDVAKVIANKSWTVIEVFAKKLRYMAVQALVENCDNLTVLNVMEHGYTAFTGAHMQTILSRAKNLKSLQVHWLRGTLKISTEDILMSEWATTSLEHIDFKIDVPRVHGQIADKDDLAEEIQSSRDIQRQLLRRLGQQKNLKRLMIGGKITGTRSRHLKHQRNCLEFTLEAGLDELKDLKKLELLDIHHMDHRAGVPELEWMVKNWPRLSHIRGILDCLYPPGDKVQVWMETRRPSWR